MRIGIVLSEDYDHYRRMLLGCFAWGAAHRVEVVRLGSDNLVEGGLRAPGIDALVSQCQVEATAARLRGYRIPVVVVTGRLATGLPTVLPDPQAAGTLAAGHLVGLGLRRLAWVAQDFWLGERRGAGFLAEAERCGAAAEIVAPGELPAWVAAGDGPAGAACGSDSAARIAVRALLAAGLDVPRRCAVIGMDNDPMQVNTCPVPLTSIDLDSERVGWRAAELAAALAAGKAAPRQPILIPPVGVVARASSDVLAVADPWMAKAVRVLRAQACSGRAVGDLLAGLPVSRRMVERFFRTTFGHSPTDEIERLRMAEARRMLESTALPVRAVGQACGFASMRGFIRAFTRCHGRTPGVHRADRAALRLMA
jgi:LacI family transcriptional regulator